MTADLISSMDIIPIIERAKATGTAHQVRLARLAFLQARHAEGVDPRLVLRYRKGKGVCISCGITPERYNGRPAVLCLSCSATLAYCAGCEIIYARRPSLQWRRASEYCKACKTANQRKLGNHTPLAVHLANRQRAWRAALPDLIERYRAGETLSTMADALGLPRNRVERIIRSAREWGEWPAGLRRYRRKGASNGTE